MVQIKPSIEYNKFMERYDIFLPYEMGDIKDLIRVAYVEDDRITFTKELTIKMVMNVLSCWEEYKEKVINRNPIDEEEFVLDPDGVEK